VNLTLEVTNNGNGRLKENIFISELLELDYTLLRNFVKIQNTLIFDSKHVRFHRKRAR